MALDGTYAGLLTSIAGWVQRGDLTAIIPDFIVLAEARINGKLRIRAMETPMSVPVIGGTRTAALPTGFRAGKSIYLNDSFATPLTYMPSEQLRWQFPANITEKPLHYSAEGENFVLGPVPDTNYTINGIYYMGLPALSGTVNDLFTKHPEIYLWYALAEAWDYQHDDSQTQKYLARGDGAIKDIMDEDARDRISGSSLQMRTDVLLPC